MIYLKLWGSRIKRPRNAIAEWLFTVIVRYSSSKGSTAAESSSDVLGWSSFCWESCSSMGCRGVIKCGVSLVKSRSKLTRPLLPLGGWKVVHLRAPLRINSSHGTSLKKGCFISSFASFAPEPFRLFKRVYLDEVRD